MSKPYSMLRNKMKLAARKKAAEKTRAFLDAMPLQELRHARNLSQEQLAQTLSVKQAAVSKIEKRTDMYISTVPPELKHEYVIATVNVKEQKLKLFLDKTQV